MLDSLRRGFEGAALALKGQTRLTSAALAPALREVRNALVQADVNLEVARAFVEGVEADLLGEVVRLRDASGQLRDLTPADHFVKACHDRLVALMGPADPELNLTGRPAVVMMVGLQGSGKTTTSGKLARMLQRQGRKPMLVACDIYRPAAIEQLMVLGRRLSLPVFSLKGMKPIDLAKAAVTQARSVGRDVVILDTAGRLAIDEPLMKELEGIRDAVQPSEILFVADAMIGQDAVRTAAEFDRRLSFTGFVLTKMDGDARGGAALSIKHVTGKPVKLVGAGEDLDKLERFRPEGLAQRILGFGDVVGLVEDFAKHGDEEKATKAADRMMQGKFGYDDFLDQMQTIRRMGSLRDVMGKLPFMSGLLDKLPKDAMDEGELDRAMAIIGSMTKQERSQPDVMNPSRMRRIAKGSGHEFRDVQDLHNRFVQARSMMKTMFGGGGMAGLEKMMAGGGLPGFGLPPGLGAPARPAAPKLSAAERMAKKKKRKDAAKARKHNR
jgi:signal recognition particle subunit SRP54